MFAGRAAVGGSVAARSESGVDVSLIVGSMDCTMSRVPSTPRTVTDDDVERVIVKTLEETPPNATHWSTRSGLPLVRLTSVV